ncbi:hypothetical protein EG68_04286 [Paragonimus skrjabini miyazakii]|uniref:Uncharacterized protein n=1 Tax=Paragonimus skrjabini miyazakii TaxID=59628 RepID=A0A8S9YXU9_9TREM|nr:hypothetical protein EG68_04286 [Paragonimus skrjabini miyazakii]
MVQLLSHVNLAKVEMHALAAIYPTNQQEMEWSLAISFAIRIKYNAKTMRCRFYTAGQEPVVAGKDETLHLRRCERTVFDYMLNTEPERVDRGHR